MSQDTNVNNLIINKLTQQQYEGIATPDPTQLYMITDSHAIYLGSTLIVDSEGGGSVDIDNLSITENASNEIQTVGVIDSNDSTTAIKTWTGTMTQYEALVAAGTVDADTLYNITDETDDFAMYPTRNVGQIITSTIPLTDAGLHLLDGSLISGGGIYEEFVDYIAELYADNTLYMWYGINGADPFYIFTKSITPQIGDTVYDRSGVAIGVVTNVNSSGRPEYNGFYYKEPVEDTNPRGIFVTEADWQTAVTTYGVCGKFVYTPASENTPATVRLPKVTGFTEGTIDTETLGDLTEAGLPSIEHTHEYWIYSYAKTGASGTARNIVSGSTYPTPSTNSPVSPIYGRSSTVQPQSIKVLYYIVMATSAKTDIQIDIDEVTTDLNGKADADLSNVPNSKAILTESYTSGNSWYRIYSDGWCEQGGFSFDDVTNSTINFLKPYANTHYTVSFTSTASRLYTLNLKSTSYFIFNYATIAGSGTMSFLWEAKGYIR